MPGRPETPRRASACWRFPRWPLFLVLVTIGLTVATGIVAVQQLVARQDGPSSTSVAEAFVRGICLGEEGDPRHPDDRRSGFAKARA